MAILELVSASFYTAGLCKAGGWQKIECFNEYVSSQQFLLLPG
jgi:hypothetical protein